MSWDMIPFAAPKLYNNNELYAGLKKELRLRVVWNHAMDDGVTVIYTVFCL